MKRFLLAALAAFFVSPVESAIVIRADHGGNVARYAVRLNSSAERIEVRGFCNSACTLVLTYGDRTCITKSASFGFHLATNQKGTAYLISRYPSWVRRWIKAQGGLTSRIKVMRYDYAKKFVKTCRNP